MSKTITLHCYGRAKLEGYSLYWSAYAPDEAPTGDFTEHLETAQFHVPESWPHVYIDGHNGNHLHYSAEFMADDGSEGYLTTNAAGFPVVCNFRTGEHTPLEGVSA